jgi:cytidyltransferase-like protein
MAKQYKLALTFGRFNLLHFGHLDLFKQMGDAANEVIIGVSTAATNLSLRDRTQTIAHALAKDPDFSSTFQTVPKRQPFELIAEIKLHNPNEVILFLGHDQWELAKAFERHAGIASRLIPRLTSSSTVRGIIDAEDWALLTNHVPLSILNKVVQLRETERCLVSH